MKDELYNCEITRLPRLGRCHGCECSEISIVSSSMAEDAARRNLFAQEDGNIEAAILWLKIETEVTRRLVKQDGGGDTGTQSFYKDPGEFRKTDLTPL